MNRYRIYFDRHPADDFIHRLYREIDRENIYLCFMPNENEDPEGPGVWYFVVKLPFE